MKRNLSRIIICLLLPVVGVGAWQASRAVAEAGSQQAFSTRFDAGKPVSGALLSRQIQEATGLKLGAERRGEQTDGGLAMSGPDQPDDLPFPLITEVTIETYRGPLRADQEAAIREVIARHQPVSLRAVQPDYTKVMEARLAARGLEGRVSGDPYRGFSFILQGPISESQRAAVQEVVSEWGLQVQQ